MRGTIATGLDDSSDGPMEERRNRSGRVRLSWVSREGLIVLLGLVVGATVVAALNDGGPGGRRGKPVERVQLSHDDLLESLAVASDQHTLISCGRDDTVRIWDLRTDGTTPGREIDRLPHGSHPFALAPSPDRRFLAVGGQEDLAVWEDGESGWRLAASMPGDYRGLDFAPDSRTLAIGTAQGTVRLVEAPSLRERATLGGFTDRVHSVAFSPDGDNLAAVAFNGELKLWTWKSGVEWNRLTRAIGPTHCFTFTPDGRSLVVAPWGIQCGGPTLWDLKSGELRRRFAGQTDGVNRLVVSPDGRFLATATTNQSVKVWEIETGEVAAVLDDDLGWVKTLVFTRDGAQIAFGGRDGAIRFWDFAAARRGVQPTSAPVREADAPKPTALARFLPPDPRDPQDA